ncbi:MAG: glycine dehydrogenase (aminomethyl-transferring) [SAR202 cluster bacterium Casp-Chloro-G4]|nr:aminomethyl-transferring glycine dehydrogenase subunit GcvPB [Chloroflexota bacterium]MDA1227547.1 aminomethyl-transferring glycine dehydrogenase subunit GcvPB [Chloroflexota bacterium]PKB61521.1 MAG: glycine dehydrogenase (aminomethyl-transferring) [SAR202 cluster bacterium Casp-Chloro-G4]
MATKNPLQLKYEESRRRLLMDRSVPGRMGVSLPPNDVPEQPMPGSDILRNEMDFPEVTEGEIVRYFSQLSQFNFSIDHNFYPLGSCTMKYNPKVNDEVAGLRGFTDIHPLQPESTVQGALKLMWELQEYLAEITGMPGVSLAPMAGADGELAGMLMARAYHLERGDTQRTKVLIPDSAHGTNPATATMSGFEVVTLPSDARGDTDLDALRNSVGDDLAGLMITLPSTLGLFDSNIDQVVKIVRDAGGIVYGDGANLNALLGRVRMGDLGFDVMHSNLHKTFTQPHGGGGPGSGPVLVGPRLLPYLPTPWVTRRADGEDETFSFTTPEKSIGRMAAFHGNFGALVRAYAYISTLGKEGIAAISDDAVLNANYVMSQLKDDYDLPYDRVCMHEVVLSARTLKRQHGVSALDVAKRLIDYGIHPPTMYFPLIVEEALMVEPTETESKETLDYFIEVMKTIAREARDEPSLLHDAPHDTPNSRLDEARAARQPDLRWRRQT